MNQKEKIILNEMLKLASYEFGTHGCNDVKEVVWKDWTKEDRIAFVKEYHDWNGDPEEFNSKYLHLPDFALMDFLAHKLLKTIDTDYIIRELRTILGGQLKLKPEFTIASIEKLLAQMEA